MWTDSHCHIDDVAVVDAAVASGVTRMITVGTDLESSRHAVHVARTTEGVWATVGLHPHDAKNGTDGLEELLADDVVVAVGECGLDYHYDHSPRPVQRDVFATQIGWAQDRDLPLVIHTREAWDDTFAILDEVGVPARTVFHCFTGGPAEAERCLERGATLSFSGIVTFKSADDVRGAAAMCPADRLLIETDSPYLAPVPHRGQPNQPAWVTVVGAAIAQVRGIPVEAVEALTWENASNWLLLRRQSPST
ncbi:MAG TPA: TatD family hydrolase [Acidimicrobiales bacterium]|nr:TatD family hydrolase [Acidimicrobiales bacterium]